MNITRVVKMYFYTKVDISIRKSQPLKTSS